MLAVDTDPRGYLTSGLGLWEPYRADPPSLFGALKEPTDYETTDLTAAFPDFDVLPSTIDGFRLEQELVASGRLPRERLGTLLESGRHGFVPVDAQPSLGP